MVQLASLRAMSVSSPTQRILISKAGKPRTILPRRSHDHSFNETFSHDSAKLCLPRIRFIRRIRDFSSRDFSFYAEKERQLDRLDDDDDR